MSAFTKLASKLPGDPEINGIDAIADTLVSEPDRIRYGVIWFDVSKITDDTDTGDRIPTIRVRRLEPLGLADRVLPEIADAVADAFQERTGRKAMPFGLVTVQAEDPDQLTIEDAEG